MTPDFRIGAMFPPARPLWELPAAAFALERLGYDELWIPEDCFAHGGFASAATALAHTTRLSVGIGLLPVPVRNVGIAAMELGSLAQLHPGRVQAAFGHGVEAWMRQIGARPRNRIDALREVVSATRSLLDGETVSVPGSHVVLDEVALDHPPSQAPPILIGTTGERGIALAGAVADGVLLPEGSTADAVTWATTAFGRPTAATVYAWLRVEDDRASALKRVRPIVQRWRDGNMYPNLVRHGGLPGTGPISDAELVRAAVAGDPRDCADAIAALREAGASSVVLVPIGDDHDGQFERVAADVFPRLS
jgi:alkanesulfonate monooxygenase SsuD/methylene tetrahydromethanopterin reductase-like flavin-dependent oxidoreductase (luciferase family)